MEDVLHRVWKAGNAEAFQRDGLRLPDQAVIDPVATVLRRQPQTELAVFCLRQQPAALREQRGIPGEGKAAALVGSGQRDRIPGAGERQPGRVGLLRLIDRGGGQSDLSLPGRGFASNHQYGMVSVAHDGSRDGNAFFVEFSRGRVIVPDLAAFHKAEQRSAAQSPAVGAGHGQSA